MVKVMKKKVVIISIVTVAVAALVILGFLIFGKLNERTLRVSDVSGDASITRNDIEKIELYKNMNILSGDSLVLNNGVLTLKADRDKYIYFDEKSELEINISGTKRKSETDISLKRGAVSSDIRKKLSKTSVFMVNTPNASVSAKGDIFRVETYEENDLQYTRVMVFKGGVDVRLIDKEGNESEEEQFVVEGNEVIICEDENNTQYVAAPAEIDYARLPATVLKRLAKISSRKLCIKKEEIEKYLEGKAEVTFKYNDKVYCIESVEKDTVILSTPTDPSVGGEWDYDFTKPVKEDIEIEWKQNSSDTEAEN